MRHYCTYFDIHFLARALVLLDSLKRHETDFIFYTLCLDDETFEMIQSLKDPHCVPIALKEIEAFDARLAVARINRTLIEYYFTLSPFLPLYLLQTFPEIQIVTYIDADCCFYASPQPIFDEMGDASVLLVEHGFTERQQHMLQFGRFNVGLLAFRNDPSGLSCLERWASQCAQWCYDRVEDGRFADQKYLDEWPFYYVCVHVLQQKGVNVAPWNIGNARLNYRRGTLLVDDVPLIMYHFHGLHFITNELYCPTHADHLKANVIRLLYVDYVGRIVDKIKAHGLNIRGYLRYNISKNNININPALSGKCFPVKLTPNTLNIQWRLFINRYNRIHAAQRIIDAYSNRNWPVFVKELIFSVVMYPHIILTGPLWNEMVRKAAKLMHW
jgi:hypothetical protein